MEGSGHPAGLVALVLFPRQIVRIEHPIQTISMYGLPASFVILLMPPDVTGEERASRCG